MVDTEARERLELRRSEPINVEGVELLAVELTAKDMLGLWGALSDAEQTGAVIDAYLKVVQCGLCNPSGGPVYDDAREVARLPARIVVPVAEKILALSEIELEGKENPPAARAETSPTS